MALDEIASEQIIPTFRLEMSSDSDDDSIIVLDDIWESEPILIVLDESSDSEAEAALVRDQNNESEDDSFVVTDESSDSDDLSFNGLNSDGSVLESSEVEELSVNSSDTGFDTDPQSDESSSDEASFDQETSGSIWCSLCERFYPILSFSDKRQRMHASGADPDRIFCLNHTSSSGFGDFYAFEARSKGVAPKHVDMINHFGQQYGYRNRDIFQRRARSDCKYKYLPLVKVISSLSLQSPSVF